MYYNSFELRCKSHFGAAKQNETICFFVEAPEFTAAYMLIKYKKDEYETLEMQRSGDGRYFLSVTFDKIGVYFYKFKLTGGKIGTGEQILYRAPDGSATIHPPFDWQQTIYSADYTTPDWLKGGVMYQIFPDRFYKADVDLPQQYTDRVFVDWNTQPQYINGSVGYVINNDYFGGNFAGIAEKIPYLQSLGVSTVYLNPIFEAHSNHRYNTANYMKADPTLGSNDDFAALCKIAHEFGIKIILDGVFSHTGSDSVYFNKSNRYDSVGAYNSQQSEYFDWYKFENWPEKYHSWWGFETLPEVNEDNDSFCNFITGDNGVIDYWMNLGADGFRLDVADELPDDFIVKTRAKIKENKSDGILIGEVWEDASNKESYSVLREYLYGHELDSVMNYPFANEILRFVRYLNGTEFINKVMQIIENYPPQTLNVLMNMLSTHDTERALTALAGEPSNSRDREWQFRQHLSDEQQKSGQILLRLAAVLQYTLPGVPSVYYGDEIVSEGYRDPFNRKAFDWTRANDKNDMLSFFKMLGVLRKTCPALIDGDFIKAQCDYNCVSYLRTTEKSEVYVMVNPSDTPTDIWLLPGWQNDRIIYGDSTISDGILHLEKKACCVMGRGDWVKDFFAEIEEKSE